MMGVCFLVNYITSSSDPTRQYCGSQYFVDSRLKYAFLEPLVKFLAFLVRPKIFQICQEFPRAFRGFP